MEKTTKQHYTASVNECSRCHKTKSIKEFGRVKEYIKKICKVCQNELNQIRDNKTKSKIILEFFKGKCYKCDTNITLLPALDFHHLENTIKTISWWNLRGRSYNNVIRDLNKENVIILCVNCHILENAFVFNSFKNFILDEKLYQNSPEIFVKKIDNIIKNHPDTKKRISQNSNYIADAKYKIKIWIKKRMIIEQMYGDTCIGCRKVSIQSNLPAFSFHHFKMVKKTKGTNWRDIKRLKVEEIGNIFYRENCICLCANCHRMLHAINFEKNFNYILEDNLAKKTDLILKQIKDNIKNFQFKMLKIKSYFNREFNFGEIWKKYLLIIHYISIKKKKVLIDSTELRDCMNRTRQATNIVLRKLLEKKLIEIRQETDWIKSGIKFKGSKPRKFQLTKKAKNMISKLLKEHIENQV